MASPQITHRTIYGAAAILIAFVVLISLARMSPRTSTDTSITNTSSQTALRYTYDEISADALRTALRNNPGGVALIDIRDVSTFEQSHIPQSINFPADQLISGGVAPRYGKDRVVVLFDTLDADTLSTVVALLAQSNDNVAVLSGGITMWTNIGGTVLTAGDPNSLADLAKIRYITADAVQDIITQKDAGADLSHVIVDVRPESQYTRGHLPYAITLPLADIERMIDRLPATKTIIVYGATDREGFSAGVGLYDLGLTRVYVMEMTYPDWVRDDRTVVTQ
jgi:rhodanese-related sulfurtransferase